MLILAAQNKALNKLLLAFLSLILFGQTLMAQPDGSCRQRITLLTCAPGAELYSIFGHTAIRVQDSTTGSDLVFNYGTFEFAPDFYSKFIRGKLLYSLSVESFPEFIYTYQVESRSVVEQVLQLDCSEKQKLVAALQLNALEENRHYRYDFLFDNCTTRAGDIIEKNAAAPVTYPDIRGREGLTFRHLIHDYLDRGEQHWSKLGIDVLLGAKIDRPVTNKEAMFLPEILMKGFDKASKGGSQLVTPTQTILSMPSPQKDKALFTPLVAFSLLLLVGVALSLPKGKGGRKAMQVFDFLFFLVLGLAGMLLLFMWFGTDHRDTANNYNLLWALPTHLLAAFFVHSRKAWVKNYFLSTALLSVVLLLAWVFLPQQMNPSLLPVVLLIAYRSWQLYKAKDHARKAVVARG